MSAVFDPPPKEPTLEQHMIEIHNNVKNDSLHSAIGPNKKYLILQGNKVAQIFIKNAFTFFEQHFPNKNPHILTARCLQINITAVRRFKKGPTEKTTCKKPYSRKQKLDDSSPKSKESKNKKSAEAIPNEDNSKSENRTVITHESCVQPNIDYRSNKDHIQNQNSFVSHENREFNSPQVPLFPLPAQGSGYSYPISGKNMNYSSHNSILPQNNRLLGSIGTISKPTVPDIFQLSPEPQYGAPSVALATINLKNSLTVPCQSSSDSFQNIKPFGNQQGAYQYSNPSVSGNSGDIDTKNHDSDILQKQYDHSKFNFGNEQNSEPSYKF